MKIIYNIEILGWEKYNKKSTKNMPSVMISKRFFDDAKIQILPPSGKLLYLFLLLRRGDHDTNLYGCSHEDAVNSAGGRGVLVATLLDQLQSLQLLKYEKLLPNRIEKNRIEEKLKEVPARSKIKRPPEEKEANKILWSAYFEAYKKRYNVEPVRNASVNAKISQLAKRLGADAIPVVEFFLQHNGAFYLQQTHAIGLCLKDAESLHTQWLKGKAVTGTMARDFEKRQEATNQIEYFRRLSEQAET